MAQMIIGLAVAAMAQLLLAGTQANVGGAELTTAVNLASPMHDLAFGFGIPNGERGVIGRYRSVWELNGRTFSPPVDAGGRALENMEGWAQQVRVEAVDKNDIRGVPPADLAARAARVTVNVQHDGRDVYRICWLVTARAEVGESSP